MARKKMTKAQVRKTIQSAKNALSAENSVNTKSSFGGTSPENAKKIIQFAIKKYLK